MSDKEMMVRQELEAAQKPEKKYKFSEGSWGASLEEPRKKSFDESSIAEKKAAIRKQIESAEYKRQIASKYRESTSKRIQRELLRQEPLRERIKQGGVARAKQITKAVSSSRFYNKAVEQIQDNSPRLGRRPMDRGLSWNHPPMLAMDPNTGKPMARLRVSKLPMFGGN